MIRITSETLSPSATVWATKITVCTIAFTVAKRLASAENHALTVFSFRYSLNHYSKPKKIMNALRSFISGLFAKRHVLRKNRMAEQSILDAIPDDWATEIDPRQLAKMALQARHGIIYGFAEQLNITPSNNLDTLVAKIATARNVSLKQEVAALEITCIQSAKIDLFIERYGHLFEMNKNGDLSYSIPMMRKITGMPLPG